MQDFERERDLIPKVVASSPDRRFYEEVPLFKKMMDLYALAHTKNRESFAYELKLENWQRGLDQASRYLLAANYVYLVVPKQIVPRVLGGGREKLDHFGIGLIGVDGRANEVISADRSRRILPSCQLRTIQFLTERRDKEVTADAP